MAARELPDMPAGPLLELHGQRKRFHIPQGLKILLEEASREVLRAQPENIYQFLAEFIEDKIVQRDFGKLLGSGKDRRKSWEWRRWSWDGSSLLTREELLQFLNEFHITIEVAEHLAVIIQSAYRGFMARQEVKAKKEGKQRRKESLWEEWRHAGNLFVSARDVEEILAYYGITLFEANAFATKIQAVFRGHYRRESLKKENPELAEHLNSLGITHHEASHHATKIQSLFRGYKARKAVKEMKEGKLVDEFEGEEEEYLDQGIGGEDYAGGPPGSMAQAKTDAATIQDGTSEEEEEETPRSPSQAADDPSRSGKPKYDAFFPGGYKDLQPTIVDGIEVPPPFTHEHFGNIDPAAVREKFSTTNFKQRMSQMFKELDGTKEERKKNIEAQEMEKVRLRALESADSRKPSVMPDSRKPSMMPDSRKPSMMPEPDSRKPSVMPDDSRKASAMPQPQSSKASIQEQPRPSISAAPPQAAPGSRKSSLEQAGKPAVPEGRKGSDPPVPSSTESRKSSKDDKVPDQERKVSDPKPALEEASADKGAAKEADSVKIINDRNVSMQADESVRLVLQEQLAKQQSEELKKAKKTQPDDYDLTELDPSTAGEDEIRAATKIQSRVRGMQTRSKSVAFKEQSKSQASNPAETKDSRSVPIQSRSSLSGSVKGAHTPKSPSPRRSGSKQGSVKEFQDTAAEQDSAAIAKTQSGSESIASTKQPSSKSASQTSNSVEKKGSVASSRVQPSVNIPVRGTPPSSSNISGLGTQASISPSETERREEAAAATKIQARVRGMQTRAQFNAKKAENDTEKPESSLGDSMSSSTVENGSNLQGSSNTRSVPLILLNDELIQSAADHVTRARAAEKAKKKPPTPPSSAKDEKPKNTEPSFPQQIVAMAPNQIKTHPPEIRNVKPVQFPAGGRRSHLENYLLPAAPPPNSVFASPVPIPVVPLPDPANDVQDGVNRRIQRPISSRAAINLMNQTTIAEHVDSMLQKALDVVETLDSIITDPNQDDYSTYEESEDEYESRPSSALGQRKISAISMDNYTSERITALFNDDDLDELRQGSNASFGLYPEENGGGVAPAVPARSNSSRLRGSAEEEPGITNVPVQSDAEANKPDATKPQIVSAPQVNLKNMTTQMDEEISDEWLDNSLGFLEVSEWSARIRDYLDNQLALITGVLTGEIPASEAPAQTLGLAIAFVVGIGAGYALLKKLLEKTSPHKAPEDFLQITAAVAPFQQCRAQ